MSQIGWKFPRTDGGVEAGIHDAGIVTFDGAPLSSLAREIIQNSLDARDDDERPVHITFELREVATAQIHGDELAIHLDRCIQNWSNDSKARIALQEARAKLDSEKLTLLGIMDTNTTGLFGEGWRHLVKLNGASFKRSESAGGSFGVGKAAPFTVSPLRTVCYWTAFKENGILTEKFQGKSVLVSHEFNFGNGLEMTQSTGFFGYVDQCREVIGSSIPGVFRNVEGGDAVQGTAVWIAGFNPQQYGEVWQRAVARSIVENFFCAIQNGDLEVLLEPYGEDGDDSLWEIDRTNLPSHFETLKNTATGDLEADALDRAHLYWQLLTSGPPTAVWDPPDNDLGKVKVWIGTEDQFAETELPNRVALIRGTGMIVTDQQHRFRGLRDYVAVCVIDDEDANRLLRDMENPAHDRFQFERLHEAQRDRGRLALDRLARFLRTQLGIHASPPKIEVTETLDELSEYLFDDHPGPLSENSRSDSAEAAFGQVGSVKLKAPRIRVRPPAALDLDEENTGGEEGEGTESGNSGGGGGEGGGGDNGRGGEGEGTGGSGSRGGSKGHKYTEMRDVRLLQDPENDLRMQIAFSVAETAAVELRISEAGDASAISRTDLKVFDEDGQEIDLSN